MSNIDTTKIGSMDQVELSGKKPSVSHFQFDYHANINCQSERVFYFTFVSY